MIINNYGELKTVIASWLDRDDLTEQIPFFIGLAERSIFRKLRIPAHEKVTHYTVNTEDALPIPSDYLEARSLLINGKPVERVSDIYAQSLTDDGTTRYFSRVGGEFVFKAALKSGDVATLNYWADESGMSIDTDTTNVLRVAPDLYVYGAMMEAEKYLGAEGRIAQTKAIFESKLSEIQAMADQAELSGSSIEVKNAY